MTAQQTIDAIDAQIDANRRVLMNRLHANPGMSAFAWQQAWDRCPDLHAIDHQLFRQRGIAQQQRDMDDHKAWLASQRKQRRNRKLCCIDQAAA